MLATTSADTFHDLLSSTLELILVVMSHSTPENSFASAKIVYFISAHQDTLIPILKNPRSHYTLSSLSELKLITGMFALLGCSHSLVHKQVFFFLN